MATNDDAPLLAKCRTNLALDESNMKGDLATKSKWGEVIEIERFEIPENAASLMN
jgi:hypothetical protein